MIIILGQSLNTRVHSFNANADSLGFAPIQPVGLKELTLEVERQENHSNFWASPL